jgi:hypothetical protein
MTYKIEANPQISETCKTYINLNLKPTIEEEGEYKTFALDYVHEILGDEIAHNGGESIFGINPEDIEELENLLLLNVDFIEFQTN